MDSGTACFLREPVEGITRRLLAKISHPNTVVVVAIFCQYHGGNPGRRSAAANSESMWIGAVPRFCRPPRDLAVDGDHAVRGSRQRGQEEIFLLLFNHTAAHISERQEDLRTNVVDVISGKPALGLQQSMTSESLR